MRSYMGVTLGAASVLALSFSAHANLSTAYQFKGTGNWSLDAVGSNGNPVGIVQASVPAGSTIEKAFLYSSQTIGMNFTPQVSLNDSAINGWTALGVNNMGLQAYRADVTSFVKGVVGSGGSTYDFTVKETSGNNNTDGEVLAVIYSNPSEQERTIAFMDGFTATTGDSFSFNFASPLVKQAGFEATMSLGIGYSYQSSSSQFSKVDVNGQRISSWAGGEDDGASYNGGLITVGGLGDSTANPADPYASPVGNIRYDDELYNIDSFLSNGDTTIKISTLNPSADDNIFFTGFNITAKGGVVTTPDGGSTIAMMGLTLGVLAGLRKSRRS